MKNPSSANERFADKTIQNLEKEIHRLFNTAASLYILNLFAIRATATQDVRQFIEQHGVGSAVGHENDHTLLGALDDSDHIVAAWGQQSRMLTADYEKRVRQVVHMLNDHRHKLWYVGGLSKDKRHPRHPMRWKSSDRAYRFPSCWQWW